MEEKQRRGEALHTLSLGDAEDEGMHKVWQVCYRPKNNGMANKYVKNPYTPHHPRYICIGVETKVC